MDQNIYLVGLNHRSAEVDIREKYALTNLSGFEEGLMDQCPVREIMALSTCNRVEIVCVGDDSIGKKCTDEELAEIVLKYWANSCGGDPIELKPHVYVHHGLDAVNHLFRVSSSLDSMVMGEPQILGQLKNSYRSAVEKGTVRVVVNRLLHKAFSVAKRVRTETALASNAVSISYAAVELAKRIFGDLSGKKAMLVGAGEMAELAATHLLAGGLEQLYICNRTYSRAEKLAKEMDGEAVVFEELHDRLADVDIVISSTGSPVAVIKAKEMKKVIKARKYRPMFFIDIAVPRDIDPDVNQLDNVYLYDIDDLNEVVEENKAQRRGEAVKAESIVEGEVKAFETWVNSLALQPTIVDLYGRADKVAQDELEKALKRLGDVDEKTKEVMKHALYSMNKKMLHEPISFLKRRTQEEGTAEKYIDYTRRMFNLDADAVPADAHADRKTRCPFARKAGDDK